MSELADKDQDSDGKPRIVKSVDENGKAVWTFSDGSPVDRPERRWDRLVFDNRPQERL